MESSQIALMDVNLNKRNFCTWKLNRPATVGIQLSIMRDMLKAGGGDDFWRLYQFPDDEEIHMEMYSKKYNTSKLHFSWKSMDIEMESMTPPDVLILSLLVEDGSRSLLFITIAGSCAVKSCIQKGQRTTFIHS